jgi:hypothetical protein
MGKMKWQHGTSKEPNLLRSLEIVKAVGPRPNQDGMDYALWTHNQKYYVGLAMELA